MSENRKTILVTGAAGFIGFHTCKLLLEKGYHVIGVDSLTEDSNSSVKISRLAELGIRLTPGFVGRISTVINGNFSFFKSAVQDPELWSLVNEKYRVDQFIHLAIPEAKKEDTFSPKQFALRQFEGFIQVLDFCGNSKVQKLFYAHTLEMNFNSLAYLVDERYTLNNTIQWMNDHWASAYWELYNLQAMALEFPQVFGDWNRLDGFSHYVFGGEKKVVAADQLAWNANCSSAKYCEVEAVTSNLLGLIEDQSLSFDQVAFSLGLDSWKYQEEVRSQIKV